MPHKIVEMLWRASVGFLHGVRGAYDVRTCALSPFGTEERGIAPEDPIIKAPGTNHRPGHLYGRQLVRRIPVYTSSRLQARRWRWRVVVLIVVLTVVGALIWRGYDPLAAAGITLVIFLVAAHIVTWIIDDQPTSQPSVEGIARTIGRLVQAVDPRHVHPAMGRPAIRETPNVPANGSAFDDTADGSTG
ncbi:hypothetical protein [Virgisporangium aurantiacum]|uniref:Uncharacterized protein n=1 Tax=Virgisporangium aurantiacum TaxID=175570 RepID=A0A8J3Z430_9ACTN|nr:hypothetical protein [Virgisporangium aurantiacum]GIJ56372.1 hypothetical protein Vau01_038880 [Virgisporangium aurantiacum]